MTIWMIEPRDPLIVRDGRPFSAYPGARATTLSFPVPSTIAGGIRTLAGRDALQRFDIALAQTVKDDIVVHGPLLVELDDPGSITRYYAPAPADAMISQGDSVSDEHGHVRQLVPLELPPSTYMSAIKELLPVGQPGQPDISKPHSSAPRFWCWSRFKQWLMQPASEDGVEVAQWGLRGLEHNARMHVRITPETQTAEEGFLFQTSGLEFTGKQRQRLALAVAVEHNDERLFKHVDGAQGEMAPLGGERRLMRWSRTDCALPEAPDGLFKKIAEQRACRIVLLTPGYFAEGFAPSLATLGLDSNAKLVAAAVPRQQVVSGWDMIYQHADGTRGAPKPTRRLAPAGSVYFVRLDSAASEAQILEWAQQHWMCCIGDDRQANRDGFGLAVLGVWDGKTASIGADNGTA